MSSLVWWSAIASALHVLALGIGLGAGFARARALRGPFNEAAMHRALFADNFYGVAALLWLGTGLWRLFGPVAKTASYYFHNGVFHAKLTLFVCVLLLEIYPMVTLIRWRIALGKGQAPDTRAAPTLGMITYVEVTAIVVIVFLAALMARGVGQF